LSYEELAIVLDEIKRLWVVTLNIL